MPCGQGRHIVRWEAGTLRLPSHPDPEAELVLAALGGEKARCAELAEAWGRHTEDLSVLAIGPRGPADEIAVSWDDVDAAVQGHRGGWTGRLPLPGGPGRGPMRLASPSIPTAARAQARRLQDTRDRERAARRRNDMLSLLALGYGFQVRLIGQVAQAHAGRPDEAPETETGPAETPGSRPRWSPRSPANWGPRPRSGSASTPTRWWCRCTAGPDGDRSS